MSRKKVHKLSPRQRQVLLALSNEFSGPDAIAKRAGIRTTSPRHTVAKYCAEFVKLRLAEKGGTRWSPKDTPNNN
jgi:hypothetical protein